MSNRLAPGCKCCGKKHCEWTDNFNNPQSYFWYQSTTTGVEEAGFSLLGEAMKTVGEGSITVETTIPEGDQIISVETQLIAGLGGVCIRRADSAENVRFVKVGNTNSTHHFELWHGSTLLDSVDWTGAAIIMRLEISTPNAGTTQVKVSMDDTFASSVVANETITFSMPDRLHVGLIADGESTWEYLKVSPCPELQCHPWTAACPHESDLSMIMPPPDADPPMVPISWTFTMPEPTDNYWGDCDDTNRCREYRGDITLLRYDKVSEFGEFGYADVQWYQPMPHITCGWTAIIDNMDPGPETCLGFYNLPNYDYQLRANTISKMPPGKYPRRFISCCRSPGDVYGYATGPLSKPTAWSGDTSWPKQYETYNLSVGYQNFGTPEIRKYGFIFTLQVAMNTPQSPPWKPQAVWKSDPIYWADLDAIDSAITLTFDANASASGGSRMCLDWAESVTLTPNGNSPVARRAAVCSKDCNAPIDFVTNEAIRTGTMAFSWVSFEDPSNHYWDMPVCFSYEWDPNSNNYWWFAYSQFREAGMPEMVEFRVVCEEPQEGYDKNWYLKIITEHGEVRIPATEDAQFGYAFEGVANNIVLGQNWEIYAPAITAINPEDSVHFGTCPLHPCAWERLIVEIDWYCFSTDETIRFNVYLRQTNPLNSPYASDTVYVGDWIANGWKFYLYSTSEGYEFAIYDPVNDLTKLQYSGAAGCSEGFGVEFEELYVPISYAGTDPFGVCPGTGYGAEMTLNVKG